MTVKNDVSTRTWLDGNARILLTYRALHRRRRPDKLRMKVDAR